MPNSVGGAAAISAYNLLKAEDVLEPLVRQGGFRRRELWQRINEFCSECRAIANHWLSGGSISVQFQRDCLIISGRPRG
jgi:hypothetical protein